VYIINSNLVEVTKKKQRFDFIPLLIMLFFGISVFIISNLEDKKFWTNVILIGNIESEKSRLVLYEDNTFALNFSEIDYSCTYQGNYKVDKDTIILERLGIENLTYNKFTSKYIINLKERILEPLEKNSQILRIE